MKEEDTWKALSWYCPNCGTLVHGFRDKKGKVNVECGTCHSVMVRTLIGIRHDSIDLYAPRGQMRRG